MNRSSRWIALGALVLGAGCATTQPTERMEASAGDRPPILKKEVHVVPFVFFVIER